jgi:hypothetical protein
MLRDPRPAQKATQPRSQNQNQKGRFQVVKLEQRIAPSGSKFHDNNGNHYGQNK